MSQISSWTIPNSGGSTYRAAVNSALAAVQSSSSGTAAPSPTVAGMLWYDITNSILKRRNSANTAWIEVSYDVVGATTVRGNASGSLAAETDVSMASLRTMLGFSQTLASTQVQGLPGGALLQSGVAATTAGGVTVTFPTSFSATPKIMLGVTTAAGGIMATCQSVSAASFVLQGWTDAGVQVNVGVYWMAMGY